MSIAASYKEFKPTVLFLAKFIGIYVIANLLYGWFITAHEPRTDPATSSVSAQTSFVLSVCGWDSSSSDNTSKPTSDISYDKRRILAVYEGCNGINVMIIFIAFLLAFGPVNRRLLWFIPIGLLVLHLANLSRIILLFLVALYEPDQMYFLHKYLFTAILYVVVFGLWIIWVRKYSPLRHTSAS